MNFAERYRSIVLLSFFQAINHISQPFHPTSRQSWSCFDQIEPKTSFTHRSYFSLPIAMISNPVDSLYIYKPRFIGLREYLEIGILLSLNFEQVQAIILNTIYPSLEDQYLSKNLGTKNKFSIRLKPFLTENDILMGFFLCQQQFRFSFSFSHPLQQGFPLIFVGIISFFLIFEVIIESSLHFLEKKENTNSMIKFMGILKIFFFIVVIAPILDWLYLCHIIFFMGFKRCMINSIIKLMIFLIDFFLKFKLLFNLLKLFLYLQIFWIPIQFQIYNLEYQFCENLRIYSRFRRYSYNFLSLSIIFFFFQAFLIASVFISYFFCLSCSSFINFLFYSSYFYFLLFIYS